MRDPTTPRWCIRWQTTRLSKRSFGGLLPDSFATRAEAAEEAKRLAKEQPWGRCPVGDGDRERVRYVVFARREDEPHGL